MQPPPTTAPRHTPAPDSPRSSHSPPPQGPQGDLEAELFGLAHALYNLATTVVSDSSRDLGVMRGGMDGAGKAVGAKINTLIQHLETIDTLSTSTHTPLIPLQVITDIDHNRNPMNLTRERLERAATENQFMNAKVRAVESYRTSLNAALAASFPEITEALESGNSVEQSFSPIQTTNGIHNDADVSMVNGTGHVINGDSH